MRARLHLTPAAAVVVGAGLAIAGCASSNGAPLQTNSIRDALNSGGTEVASVERRFEMMKVRSLAKALPICIAYRMPAKAPYLTASFKDALRAIGENAKAWRGNAIDASLLHARLVKDTAAAFPAEIAVGATQAVRDDIPGLPVRYEPVPKDQFRERARCGDKDTVFVDRERITFYKTEFPSELSWSGLVHIGDVLFLRISGRAPPKETAERMEPPDAARLASPASNIN
ncbi:MAG: hypothetical protein KDJ37_01935 [Hyphomicrobiaceae bacterium]|nr:hypothetical protein [Hyphomicrobiaceae bacterium]